MSTARRSALRRSQRHQAAIGLTAPAIDEVDQSEADPGADESAAKRGPERGSELRPALDPGDALGAMPTTNTGAYATHSAILTAFDRFASKITRLAGSPLAFSLACVTVLIWAVTGPIFRFSDGWQLVINTGTTIMTFLMVFLIQQSQNKDSVALHLKLNELIAANRQASNRMIGIEDLDEQDLREVADFYVRLAERAKIAGPHKEMHSIDEEGMPSEPGDRRPARPSRRI
jgi:low affinity Fe/Cu permease